MADKDKQDTGDRTGTYGGDDGAMENERADIRPGEDTGLTGMPTEQRAQTDKTQAEHQQDKDLETGEENPG
jgi:hypothetical protein